MVGEVTYFKVVDYFHFLYKVSFRLWHFNLLVCIFTGGYEMKKGLARFLGKYIAIYTSLGGSCGMPEIIGTLELGENGFLVVKEMFSITHYLRTAYVSKRALIKRKRAKQDKCYKFFIKGNYDIFKKPSSGGFRYTF